MPDNKPSGSHSRRVFFRILCYLPIVALRLASPVFSDPVFLPSLSGGDSIEIVEKENVRRRIDGRYSGYIYREYRGYLNKRAGGDEPEYEGSFYLLEDLSNLGQKSKLLESRVDSTISIGAGGPTRMDESSYPRTAGFPSIPRRQFEIGDTWREYGERIVDPRLDGRLTRVEFYCEYRYEGVIEYGNSEVYLIRAQYALRYRRGADPLGDPDLSEVSGSHIADIMLYADGSGRAFVRTQVDESYRFVAGEIVTYQGFLLTWINDLVSLDREQTKQSLAESLGSTHDVVIEEVAEGVSIQLQSIHFVPDSPEILPDERGRLDAIFDSISDIEDRIFLVVGHTADVGTAESQQLLSVERAKTVVGELIDRGLGAGRFLHEGKGGTLPVSPNDTEENRAKNRRVEIIILDP